MSSISLFPCTSLPITVSPPPPISKNTQTIKNTWKSITKRKTTKINTFVQAVLEDKGEKNNESLFFDKCSVLQQNEKHVQQSIDDEFEALQSQLKSRKEEMKRRLYNDIEAIKRPVQEQLRKHRSINTTIDHHQRKLSLIKATQDPSLRIKVGVAVSTHFFFCKQVCKTLMKWNHYLFIIYIIYNYILIIQGLKEVVFLHLCKY